MGKMQRRKGYRVEHEIVAAHLKEGIQCERVPLSGAAGGSYTGDLRILDFWTAEVKARKNGGGFKTIEDWLGENDMLFLKRNQKPPLVVLPWDVYIHLMYDVMMRRESIEEARDV